jgi:hypothetical protein
VRIVRDQNVSHGGNGGKAGDGAFVCLPAASDAPTPGDAAAAARPATGVERVGLLPTEARRANELETVFPDDVIVRIGDGDDRAVGVYRDAIQPKALGVIVIVLGSGMSADSTTDSTTLRRTLARRHWATLAVALPDIPNEPLPPRQRDKFVEGAIAPAAPTAPPAKAVDAQQPADPMPARIRRLDGPSKRRAAKRQSRRPGEGAAGAWIAWAKSQGSTPMPSLSSIPARRARIDSKRPDTLAGRYRC